MGMKAIKFVGAKREAYLPDWIPVDIRIVNNSRVRSYVTYSNQSRSTYHDTGNERTKAEGEYQWLAGGRQGGELGGYNFIFDDGIIIQTVPLNEVTWHAGTPEGNRTSWGSEHAFGGGTDWQLSLKIGAALHGALIEMQDLDPDDASVLHQFWYGKYCSAQILNRGVWPQVKAMIKAAYNASRAARLGKPSVEPNPVYVPTMPVIVDGVTWDGLKDVVSNGILFHAQKGTVTVNVDALNGRQFAGTGSPFTNGGKTRGTKLDVLGWVAGELVAEEPRWWVGTDGTRYWAGGIAEEPKEWTDYQKPDVGMGMLLVNGRVYYPLIDPDTGKQGRSITITGPANLRRWAGTGSPIVGTRQAGDEETAEYWTVGEKVGSETIWYVLDAPEGNVIDGGARIWVGNTKERPK